MSAPKSISVDVRNALVGALITLAVAAVTAMARSYDHSKLDTERFVADSINASAERREFRTILNRIDSTTKRTDARVDIVFQRLAR